MTIDLRDMMLEAAAEMQSLLVEFQKMLATPQAMAKIAQLWMETPEEWKERFAQERPEDYAALMDALKKT